MLLWRTFIFGVTLFVLSMGASQANDAMNRASKLLGEGASSDVSSIEGTTWAGTDSDGDYYAFTFKKGGQIHYVSGTGDHASIYEDKGDEWAQNGSIVMILLTHYSARQGTINGDRMRGKAWNKAGKTWTWTLKKQ